MEHWHFSRQLFQERGKSLEFLNFEIGAEPVYTFDLT